jgi:hypothetical protein
MCKDMQIQERLVKIRAKKLLHLRGEMKLLRGNKSCRMIQIENLKTDRSEGRDRPKKSLLCEKEEGKLKLFRKHTKYKDKERRSEQLAAKYKR